MDEESIVRENLIEKQKHEMVTFLRDNLLESNVGVGIISLILLSSTFVMWHTRGTIIPVIVVIFPLIIFSIMIDVKLVVSIYMYVEYIVYSIIMSPYYLVYFIFKKMKEYCFCCCNNNNKKKKLTPSGSPPRSAISNGSSICGYPKALFNVCYYYAAQVYSILHKIFCCLYCRDKNNSNTTTTDKNTKSKEYTSMGEQQHQIEKQPTLLSNRRNNTAVKRNAREDAIDPKTLSPSIVSAPSGNNGRHTNASKASIVEQLISLSKLKEQGLLTDEEFHLAKQRILKGGKSN